MFRPSVGFIIQHLSLVAISITDTLMVTKLGNESLATVGLISHFYIFYFTLCYGLQSGASSLISNYLGRKDRPNQLRVQNCLIGLSSLMALCGLVFMFTYFLFNKDNPQNHQTLSYLKYFQLSIIPHYLFSSLKEIMGASMDIKRVSYIVIGGILFNFLSNHFFIFELGLGVEGAGLATLMTRLVMFFSLLIIFIKKFPLLNAQRYFDFNTIKKIIHIGTPGSVFILIRSGVFTFCALMINSFSSIEMAGHILILNLATLLYTIYGGYSQNVSIQIGKAMGNQNTLLLKNILYKSISQVSLLGFFAFTCLYFFNGPIGSFFQVSSFVLAKISQTLPLLMIFFISDSLFWISHNGLRSMNIIAHTPISSIVIYLFLILPISFAFIPKFGLIAFWGSLALGVFFLGIYSLNLIVKNIKILNLEFQYE